jgi:hypothetical protein
VSDYTPGWHGTEVTPAGTVIHTDMVSPYPPEVAAAFPRLAKLAANAMYGAAGPGAGHVPLLVRPGEGGGRKPGWRREGSRSGRFEGTGPAAGAQDATRI